MAQGAPDPREPSFDQRLLTFLLLSAATVMLWTQAMAPPRPAAKPDAQAQELEEAQQLEEGVAQNGKAKTDPAAPEVEVDPAAATAEIEADPPAKPELVTLGSLAADANYRMAVSANNVGAAIDRIELSSRKHRDLDQRWGYLGQLGLQPGAPGPKVTQICPGAPADAAGLKVGDLLLSVGVQELTPVEDDAALDKLLRGARPGQKLQIKVQRGGAAQTLTAKLTRRPLCVLRPEAENIRLHTKKIPEGFRNVPSFLLRIESVGELGRKNAKIVDANRRLTREAWTIEPAAGAESEKKAPGQAPTKTVSFRMRLAELGLEVVKKFTLTEIDPAQRDDPSAPDYHLDLDIEVRNLLPTPQSVAYRLEGPNGLPIEGWWYATKVGNDFASYGIRDVVARFQGNPAVHQRCLKIAEGEVEPMEGAPLAYVGVDAQYFAVVMLPKQSSFGESWFEKVDLALATKSLPQPTPLTWNNPTCSLVHSPVDLAPKGEPDATLTEGYRVFAGPKRPELLAKYYTADDPNYAIDDVQQYGWNMVAAPAHVMQWILHRFYGLVGNYGLAIILLTIVVRGSMFPLSRWQTKSMMLMQQLKPELDKLAEKYKTDLQKRSQAQQELFRKHNYHPASGCLPMFIQLPIFLGLYRALAVDVELRQAPLFSESIRFCSNLASPDMLLDWSSYMPTWMNNGQGIFCLGPYFNLLPIATIALFLLQQQMFMPPPANEQAAMQQKMMKYMMVFFGLMFFKVPSGLCLYFIASSLWGIAERQMMPKLVPPTTTPAVMSKPSSPSGSGPQRSKAGGRKRR